MAREFTVNLGDDGKLGVVNLAIDIYRYEFLCRLFDLTEKFPDTGCFPGARQPFADRVQWPAPAEPGPDLEGQLAHLAVPELKLLGNIIDLKDIGIPEDRLIPQDVILPPLGARHPD